jgi:hypothetical protein
MTWLLSCARTIADTGPLERTDFHVLTSDGVQIAVREVRLTANEPRKSTPIILVHGVRVPGIASFDLPVPGGSLAADLASFRIRHLCDGRQRVWQLDQTKGNGPAAGRNPPFVSCL